MINVNDQAKVISFVDSKTGSTVYSGEAALTQELLDKTGRYKYQGAAFEIDNSYQLNDFYLFSNTSTGEIRYSTISDSKNTIDSDFIRSDSPSFQASANARDGLIPFYQIRNRRLKTSTFSSRDDAVYIEAQNKNNLINDGVVFYAKPVKNLITEIEGESQKSKRVDINPPTQEDLMPIVSDENHAATSDNSAIQKPFSNNENLISSVSLDDGWDNSEEELVLSHLMDAYQQQTDLA